MRGCGGHCGGLSDHSGRRSTFKGYIIIIIHHSSKGVQDYYYYYYSRVLLVYYCTCNEDPRTRVSPAAYHRVAGVNVVSNIDDIDEGDR